jgi:ribonuclease HI/endonuclease/exonuclease/phosphatase family metal-dependent hydrolase
MTATMMQWNCEGIEPKVTKGDVLQYIKESGATILVWQETKLAHNQNFKIKGFRSYLNNLEVDNQNAHGGVAIFVKNFASSYRIKLNTTLQAIAVSVKIQKRITICSIYLPPNEEVQLAQLQNLINQLPKPFLLLGDFNAHHPMWHDPRQTDARGRTIVDLITENDVALLDKNKMTHIWKVDKTMSHIDLSICSTELLPHYQWEVHEETLNSDHFPILLKTSTPMEELRPEKWIPGKADWNKFKEQTNTDRNIQEFNTVEEAANFLESHIKEAASKTIPKTKGIMKTKSPPWWNKWCRAAVQKRKATFRRYTRATNDRNYNSFSKARAEAKRQIKFSKRSSWSNFINSINHKSKSRDLWKKIKMLTNKYTSETVNTLIINDKEVKISNIPTSHKPQIIEKLCSLGCIQTLKSEEESPTTTTLHLRFEEDEATKKATELDGQKIQNHTLKAQLIQQNNMGQPTVLDDPKDIADCLGKRYAFVSSTSSGDDKFQQYKDQAEKDKPNFDTNTHYNYNDDLTLEEMLFCLNLSKDSATGPDEICYSMLKNLAPSGQKLLLELLNLIFKKGEFPKSWKEAYIIPILKEGKDTKTTSSYRPIALTSCICKLLERILNRRLVWYLESKGLIDRCQNGFRKGRNTTDSLAALATDAHNAFRRKQYLLCVFFDLSKAYDTCWKHLIMKQLHKFGLRGRLPKAIESYLSDRRFKVRVGNTLSDEYEQEMGVPQGGVLSCTLFNIAINTVTEIIKGMVSYSLYVDDKRIAYASTDPQRCQEKIQEVLDKLQRWTEVTGFKFNTDKTEWMIFVRNKQKPKNITLKLEGKLLKEVQTKKFLGLIFDSKLSWELHIDYIKGKCLKAMNILYIISRGNKEIDCVTLLRIYRAIVRSKLEYGAEIYGTAPKYILEKLDTIHHKGLRTCLGAYRSSPIPNLYALTGEMSLKHRREMLQMFYYVKMKQFLPHELPVRLDDRTLDDEYSRVDSNKPISLGYSARQSFTKMNINLPHITLLKESNLGPWETKSPKICTYLTKYEKASTPDEEFLHHFHEHRHNTNMEIYTDGSKDDKSVGSGVSIYYERNNNSIQRKLHSYGSIFTAELYAIKLALIRLKTCHNITCTIYSDSLSAIQAIQNQAKHRLVLEIRETIPQLIKRKIKVTLCWIPGHVGITGNEEADKLAKEATKLNIVSTQELPPSDIKPMIKNTIRQRWKVEWEKETVKSKELFDSPLRHPLNLGLKRREATVITRLQIGHTRLTHTHIFNRQRPENEEDDDEDRVIQDLRCEHCGGHYTVKHILVTCPGLHQQRQRFFDPQITPLKHLLTTTEGAHLIIKFTKTIGIFTQL